ncbi:hypothetical protein SAY87_005426 [Trapa incisa]|uniref:Rho GTPase-activating protein 7 n=1 Tax=Trapa incisa TaxID=236973 RepID=A0AAN7Q719_9MYRT|nr:hypothetical protein SAY87_005426 [Trapa incisa]
MSASLAAFERPRPGVPYTVFKSGPLFISSKGLGWKSWKKRWFILTRTSLVFFKNDPSSLPQRGGEVNLTLGGIDLNNSGSVVVREDKKLLTVLFPDGRDGRAFTLKAETLEDLYEWKTALEDALDQAPSAALAMGQNGIFRNDPNEVIDEAFNQWREKRPVKSLVVGRPILLALEDIDGQPSFLEKALQFLEKYGIKVEGILRQSADVDEVDRRVQEYEKGKVEFTAEEDAHVIGDCVKHVLRELPSSPVPASCCTALLEAYKIDRKEAQVYAMQSAIQDTFPEPNRRLLQRLLKMMHTIAANACENRMTASAVAACMAPLLLRPLLSGECELDDDFDVNGDGSAQLLAAANAANNAQGIVTTLLEEYENIFDDENPQRCSISADSHIENSVSEDSSEDDLDDKQNGYHDAENEDDQETDENPERIINRKKLSETSGHNGGDLYEYKIIHSDDSGAGSPRNKQTSTGNPNSLADAQPSGDSAMQQQHSQQNKEIDMSSHKFDIPIVLPMNEHFHSVGEILSSSIRPGHNLLGPEGGVTKPTSKTSGSNANNKRSALWGRNAPRKTPSMESVDSSGDEELAIQRLETTKNELRQRIAKEARGNAILQASLERRKQALHERRLALEQDVSRLQEQLQAERDIRAALEAGLSISSGQFSSSRGMDSKTRAELEEIALAEADVARLKQKVAELHHQLNQQRQHQYVSLSDVPDRYQQGQNHIPQKLIQQDFDSSISLYSQEKRQRSEDVLPGDWRRQIFPYGSSSRLPPGRQFLETTPPSDSRSAEASMSLSLHDIGAVDSGSASSTSRLNNEAMEYPRHPSAASSTLVELTTRLDFFKERRSQLMEQLHNLDLNHGTPSNQDFPYGQSSPSWN